jgi:hypothetical protein
MFQVSAAGTCLGCLLVGLSFLSKVWNFRYRLRHSKEVDKLSFLGSTSSISLPGTALANGLEHVRFGWSSGTYCYLTTALYSLLPEDMSSRSHRNAHGAMVLKFLLFATRFSLDPFHWAWAGYHGL